MEILPGYDIVVDGLDNFPTRYLLNDASVRLRIPVVSAAILGFDGQLSVFKPYEGPCYRCLFPVPPPAELAPSCGANGVLGVLPGTMGLLQATEVIKLILGAGDPAIGRLLHVRRARRDDDRGQGPPRPGVPDLLARSRGDLRRGDGRLPRLRGVLRRRAGVGAYALRIMATDRRSHPVLRPSVGGEREINADGDNVGEILRASSRRTRRRRRSCSAPTASSTATSTSTSTTRTCACSTGSTPASATGDTLVILPAMARRRR